MSEFIFPKIGAKQLIVLACITLIIILSNLFFSRNNPSNVKETDTQKVRIEISKKIAEPTPLINIAQEDVYYSSVSNYPPLFSVIIPKGAKYYQDIEPLFIEMENGLSIVICSTCQLFVPNCGGLSDGDVEAGGCAISEVILGQGITIGSHYQISEPNKILGYRENYKNSVGEFIGVRVTTHDSRKLTSNDKAVLYSIISSLK